TNIPQGHRFVIVDPQEDTRESLFDHEQLAKALSEKEEKEFNPFELPFQRIRFSDDCKRIFFHSYSYNLATGDLEKLTNQGRTRPSAALSPNGKKKLVIRDHNLWLRVLESNEDIRLTKGGKENFGYATNNAGWIKSDEPVVLWSPDSRKIATFRQDAREVGDMYLATTNVGHPKLEAWKYPLPGDEHIFMLQRVIIHTNPLKVVRLKMEPDAQRSTITDHVADWDGKLLDAQWKRDGSKLAFVSTSRDYKEVTLRIADANTGEVRDVFTETVPTFFESGFSEPNWRVYFQEEEVLWFSKRDNWGHLYLYDLETGEMKRQITKGNWNVKRIVEVDHENERIYFVGSSRESGNPYHEYFYRISFDGTGLECLTPESGHHEFHFSPNRKYFVDTWSSVEKPATTVLRNKEGNIVRKLEEEDLSKLKETGWQKSELIQARARDGETDLYGIMYKPTDFDPNKQYPIINHIYPGPQSGSVRSFGFSAVSSRQALAELGFVVVAINGMGTPDRSKSFHDAYYGNMGDNTLPDQITVMKQLADRHSWIDINRAGIYGHSGGGYASADAIMRYPDFFKVAVSQSGNHDNRNYEAPWGEKWHGMLKRSGEDSTNYDSQANQLLAGNLKGHLLLAHGMMDDNVPPYNTLLVVQELIKANKDFDLIMFPGSRHGYRYGNYMTRRRWDYFVRHLMGAEPPTEYDFGSH
ncbi:MAG TPA: DPP IV N-terminal domain-containing protein, partial [Bacteroidales bacterium]|nr:DPP IV N-terminal domain-containing protein [Bacteroidales bacterium]